MKNTPNDYRIFVREQLKKAKSKIRKALIPVDELRDGQAARIIGTYRVAIEPNFIPWMIQAYETSYGEKTRQVLYKNIFDEINQNHPKMLRDFAESCRVRIE